MASSGNAGEGEGEASSESPLLQPSPSEPKKAAASYYRRCLSHAGDELRSFRSCLRWMLLDQSEPARAAASWALFLLLGAIVPAAAHLALVGATTPGGHRRAYDAAVQLSLAAAAAIAYLCLTAFVRCYGLRRFLFLDKLRRESERVRLGYTAQLSRSFRLLACFVLPGFAAEVAIKLWWYWSAVAPAAPDAAQRESERDHMKIAASAWGVGVVEELMHTAFVLDPGEGVAHGALSHAKTTIESTRRGWKRSVPIHGPGIGPNSIRLGLI